MRKLWHVDHTCAELISTWIARQAAGAVVRIETGAATRHRAMAMALHGA